MQGIYEMSKMKDINGIDMLLKKLPEKFQKWHYFNHIDEFRYETVFDDSDKFENINNIEMVIRDCSKKYWIKMKLTNVSGLISFNTVNGFYSGLVINDFIECGYSKDCRYRFSSCEMDIDFNFYCEKISVELLYQ